MSESIESILVLIEQNDRRYEDRFAATSKALEVALSAVKSNPETDAIRSLIDQNDRLYNEKFVNAQRALEVALRANDGRLDSMNHFRADLTDQSNRMMVRVEAITAIESLKRDLENLRAESVRISTQSENNEKTSAVERAQLDKRLDSMNEFRAQLSDQSLTFLTKNEFTAAHLPLVEKISSFDKTNWTVLISIITAAFILVGGFWTVLGLRIENAISPITVSVEGLRSVQGSQTADIVELNSRIRNIDSTIAAGQAERMRTLAELNGKIIELNAISAARVKQRTAVTDEMSRWMSMMYEKLFPGQRFPKISE